MYIFRFLKKKKINIANKRENHTNDRMFKHDPYVFVVNKVMLAKNNLSLCQDSIWDYDIFMKQTKKMCY